METYHNYRRLRGSGSTVVTMTSKVKGKMEILTSSKVKGKMEILTSCRFETPENIETKIGQNDYTLPIFVEVGPRGCASHITACAVATSCCTSDVPFQWERRNFDPELLPHFHQIFLKLKTKKHIRDTNPHAKFGKDRFSGGIWANTQILAVHSGLPFFIFCILRSASRSHRASYGDQ